MERKLILRKISEIIVDLQEQSKSMHQQVGPINEVELEIFIANAKFLSDHALILQKINTVTTPTNLEEKTVVGTLEDLPEIVDLDSDDEELLEEIEITETAALTPNPVVEESLSPEPVYFAPEPVISVETKLPGTENIKPTVNDLMAGKPEQNRAAKFSAEPVKDLKSIISLNDKLIFVNDLFSGYSLAYQEAVDVLNRLEHFEAAEAYLQNNYIEKYNWAEKIKTADKFYELLKRRFAK